MSDKLVSLSLVRSNDFSRSPRQAHQLVGHQRANACLYAGDFARFAKPDWLHHKFNRC
jgi:hypothetical protein